MRMVDLLTKGRSLHGANLVHVDRAAANQPIDDRVGLEAEHLAIVRPDDRLHGMLGLHAASDRRAARCLAASASASHPARVSITRCQSPIDGVRAVAPVFHRVQDDRWMPAQRQSADTERRHALARRSASRTSSTGVMRQRYARPEPTVKRKIIRKRTHFRVDAYSLPRNDASRRSPPTAEPLLPGHSDATSPPGEVGRSRAASFRGMDEPDCNDRDVWRTQERAKGKTAAGSDGIRSAGAVRPLPSPAQIRARRPRPVQGRHERPRPRHLRHDDRCGRRPAGDRRQGGVDPRGSHRR